MMREVDAPFVSRHSEYSDIYGELLGEKNAYEQAFIAESNGKESISINRTEEFSISSD